MTEPNYDVEVVWHRNEDRWAAYNDYEEIVVKADSHHEAVRRMAVVMYDRRLRRFIA
jgi:hypothetical protein